MLKNNRIYLLVGSLLFVVLIALNHYAPKPLDWSMNYNNNAKSPYGCYILKDMLGKLFPDQVVEDSYNGFFVALDSTSVEKKNVIVITSGFKPDKYDLNRLLKFVAKGNDFFVSASSFGDLFLDTLKIKVRYPAIDTSVYRSGKETLILLNPDFRNDSGYHFNKKMPVLDIIIPFDNNNTVKLGTNRSGKLNFIGTNFGLGKIYIHTQPLAFTNYHLLYGNTEYASKVLSYLPVRKTVWDEYYKPFRSVNQSPMRYILSQPPLQSAYYVLLITLLLYLLVESKRRQRVIPVIKPLVNRSLQFVRTIGSLYFKQRNNADLAKKKSIYFKEFLRERYFLTTISGTDEGAAVVSAKSGVPVDLVLPLLEKIDYYEKAPMVSDIGLIEINRKMEQFYKQCF